MFRCASFYTIATATPVAIFHVAFSSDLAGASSGRSPSFPAGFVGPPACPA